MKFKIGEFSEITGLSIKTLRFYEAKGLISPNRDEFTGYRYFDTQHLIKIEQVLALKFVGFKLSEIRDMLNTNVLDLEESLIMQKEILRSKIEECNSALKAIDKIEKEISSKTELDWNSFMNIIRSFRMEKTKDWANKYYSDDAKKSIENHPYSAQEIEQSQIKWQNLIDEIKQNADIDPQSEKAQEFADRWTALINEFTQGNPEVQSGLNDLWSDIDNAPSEMKTWYEQNKAAFEFINKVFASREK